MRAFLEAGKPVAAICHGPWTLIEAGKLHGRRMTSQPSLRTDLMNAGVDWADEEVVVDGNVVSSRKPDDLPAFNREMLRPVRHGARAAAQGCMTCSLRPHGRGSRADPLRTLA